MHSSFELARCILVRLTCGRSGRGVKSSMESTPQLFTEGFAMSSQHGCRGLELPKKSKEWITECEFEFLYRPRTQEQEKTLCFTH